MPKAKGGGDTSTGSRVRPVRETDTLADLGVAIGEKSCVGGPCDKALEPPVERCTPDSGEEPPPVRRFALREQRGERLDYTSGGRSPRPSTKLAAGVAVR